MASVKDCIEKMVASGQVTRTLADEALAFYQRSQAEFSMEAGPASADAAAAVATAKRMRDTAAARQLQIATTVKAFQTGEKRLLEDPRGRNAALMGMLTKDTAIGDTRLNKLFSMLSPELEKLKAGFLPDARKLNSARDFIRERFGVDTGNPVSKAVSDGFGKAIEYGATRAKAAGKVFKQLEDWRLPQAWEPSRVARVTADEYVKDHLAEIANGGLKLFDKETGTYAKAARYDAILRRAYSDIKTEGGATGPFSKEARRARCCTRGSPRQRRTIF
jgi:hypothetical protein